ncbi:MAG TPA: hypothetical protein PLL78_12470 [Fimbriimonadaceae bacterium]|nr:hypothetical protein [Fimbriimonadaceae bacterium]HRJ97491.1 hypothetical protein [Fimbriimonadaceae bacterium]
MKAWGWLALAGLAVGCGERPATAESAAVSRPNQPVANGSNPGSTTEVEPPNPEQALYELCRAGTVQMNGAADSIEETLQTAKSVLPIATGDAVQGIKEAIELIDGAGAGIADYTAPIPGMDRFPEVAAEQDERRLKAIQAGNDAIRDLKEAAGILESLVQSTAATLRKGIGEVIELVDVCVRDLYDAVEALGGRVEE